ncbi:MAG: DDE-type integrase/transposase/recombinase, partial [Bacilli bacterium]
MNRAYKPYFKLNTHAKAVSNLINQKFDNRSLNEVITSDLTYVPYNNKFFCICFLLDLYNREIVGFSVGNKHNTDLVLNAFTQSNVDKSLTKIFHIDAGGEFKGEELITYLQNNDVTRSMSKPGCPYDNAPSERLFR